MIIFEIEYTAYTFLPLKIFLEIFQSGKKCDFDTAGQIITNINLNNTL